MTTEGSEENLWFVAKKAVGGAAGDAFEVSLAKSSTVGDLAARLAEREGCDSSLVTIVSRGVPLKDISANLQPLADKEGPGGKVPVVYIVRKPAVAPSSAADPPNAPTSSGGKQSLSAVPTGGQGSTAAQAQASQAVDVVSDSASTLGRRVFLMLRHGQCCHEGEHDAVKELTQHGHKQADETARYIKDLFSTGKVPDRRALLHSTSRRARETAAKIIQILPGIEVMNADMLRETDPTNNPLRAEEVFQSLFAAPSPGSEDTLIVVAHNNIILYWLMRAAEVPIERAAQAWNLFQLRHASITRVEVSSNGTRQVFSIGAAGHISDTCMTWNNISGPDMSAWKGGEPERRKQSGRMLVLVRQAVLVGSAEVRDQQIEAVAKHVKGLSGYMMSGRALVACTTGAQQTANEVAKQFKTAPQVFPGSIVQQPEAAFLQFFAPPEGSSRDTVVLIAEDGPLLYWLLRALSMSSDEANLAKASYSIGHASVTMINVRADGSRKVIAVGDTGHLPLSCLPGGGN